MKSRELPVKLSRIITLFGIVSAGIIALGMLVGAFLAVQPTLDTIGWHLQRGNRVAFDGHTFQLPLMWSATPEPLTQSLDIHRAYGVGYIGLTATGQPLDSAATHAWQEERIANYKKYDPGPQTRRELGHILHGKTLELVCVSTDNGFPGIGTLFDCRISNSDLQALVFADAKHQSELQSILDSSR